jgi:hypothetical protein
MRPLMFTFVSGVALAALSAQAAPLLPKSSPVELSAVPEIELVAGCGWGSHRVHWQDHWGYWHWHCVPSGHVYHGHSRLEHPYADWRGPSGGWGNP